MRWKRSSCVPTGTFVKRYSPPSSVWVPKGDRAMVTCTDPSGRAEASIVTVPAIAPVDWASVAAGLTTRATAAMTRGHNAFMGPPAYRKTHFGNWVLDSLTPGNSIRYPMLWFYGRQHSGDKPMTIRGGRLGAVAVIVAACMGTRAPERAPVVYDVLVAGGMIMDGTGVP